MSTIKLYQQDVYMKKCTAEIQDIINKDGKTAILLNQTVFFPASGGQSCDKGEISGINISNVYEKNGYVYHVIADNSDINQLSKGSSVNCSIDWDHRFDNMQRHCGEHILSGMFYREYGGVNRGFHMGDDYMTVDISLEKNPKYNEVTWEMAMHIQDCVNTAIWANLPVTVRKFKKIEETESLPLRKDLAICEDISIVCVGNESNPSDCVACCGTHPSTSAQIGLLKILKVEKNKGMFRIYFESGKRAMEKYNKQYELILNLNRKYSSGVDNLPEKIAAHEKRAETFKNELHILRKSVIAQRRKKIEKDLDNAEETEILKYEYGDMKTDDLINIAKDMTEHIKKLMLIVSSSENTLLLFSNGKSVNCGKLTKENASAFNGKGGGNKFSARIFFPNRKTLDAFIDMIENRIS